MNDPVEKPLKGGNTTPVSRLGGEVLREAGPWTGSVQRLLAHLRDEGVTWCPEPRGWASDGRETLTYLKGKVPSVRFEQWVYDEDVLVTAARWLRELHDLTVDFDGPEYTWRGPRRQPAEVICHNDFSPANMVFRDHKLVGVIDWDFASPGPRLWDLSYLAYRLVPLVGPDNPDAPKTTKDLTARLKLLMDAYGSTATVRELLEMVVANLEDLAGFTAGNAKVRKDEKLMAEATGYEADAKFLKSLIQ